MQRHAFLLQLLDLYQFSVVQFLQLGLLLLHLFELIGGIPQLDPQHIDLLLEFVYSFKRQL